MIFSFVGRNNELFNRKRRKDDTCSGYRNFSRLFTRNTRVSFKRGLETQNFIFPSPSIITFWFWSFLFPLNTFLINTVAEYCLLFNSEFDAWSSYELELRIHRFLFLLFTFVNRFPVISKKNSELHYWILWFKIQIIILSAY